MHACFPQRPGEGFKEDPLELELHMVVSYSVSAETENGFQQGQQMLLTAELSTGPIFFQGLLYK